MPAKRTVEDRLAIGQKLTPEIEAQIEAGRRAWMAGDPPLPNTWKNGHHMAGYTAARIEEIRQARNIDEHGKEEGYSSDINCTCFYQRGRGSNPTCEIHGE